MKVAIRWLLAFALLAGATVAEASFHLFRIDQIYTNADGSVQFVVLVECCGTDNEHLWAGQSLRSTGAGGTQTYVFPANLPSSSTANRKVLVATPGFAALGIVAPDFTIPANFLPIGGGNLNWANGTHTITFGPMPTDGTNALLANGSVVPNVATNFAGQSGSGGGPSTALAIEFYHVVFNHYFVTHHAKEIADLDTGVRTGWTRTTQSFRVFAAAGPGTSPVCRFYIPPDKGDSHFYGRGVEECNATALKNPTFFDEDRQFFHAILPAVGGTCPANTIPLYRVFNGRPDTNHRYTISRDIRDRMVSEQNWILEGDGDDYVVMCVPPNTGAAPTQPPPPMTPTPPPPMDPEPPYPYYP